MGMSTQPSTPTRTAQPGDDPLTYVYPDTAARCIGRQAEAHRPADLNDPADVQVLYDSGLTMIHMEVMALIPAAKSLGIDTSAMSVLIARWGALAAKELTPSLVHHAVPTVEHAPETESAPGSPEAMRAALMHVGGMGCETYTKGSCVDSGRTKDAQYGADRWCDACVANTALGLPCGREHK